MIDYLPSCVDGGTPLLTSASVYHERASPSNNPTRGVVAAGILIGKALEPLEEGERTILVLITGG